ncbi:MAG: hypothetical protein IJA30_02580 [Bacilli bacterium]|nr:hypothetical protein [Bacilli bacterium]
MLYKIVSLVSIFVRNFLLPNPYINFIVNETYAELFNIFIGGFILHKLAYWFTGNIYRKSIDDPSIGSFGYLISYVVITLVVSFLGLFISDFTLFIIVFLVLYLLACIFIGKLFDRNDF